jgi:hypothetical protein
MGVQLQDNEQVHHKDENPLNNDLNNLEIKLLGEHQREHNQAKYHDKVATCQWCNKEFLWTARQQRDFYKNKHRRNNLITNPFCSKKCVGEYGRHIQSQK